LEVRVRALAIGGARHSGDEAQAPVAAGGATWRQCQPHVALAPDLKTPEMPRRYSRNQNGAVADRQRPSDEIRCRFVLLGNGETDHRRRLAAGIDTKLTGARRQTENREELFRHPGDPHGVLQLADPDVLEGGIVNGGHCRKPGRAGLHG
jgi:hypothetical protein